MGALVARFAAFGLQLRKGVAPFNATLLGFATGKRQVAIKTSDRGVLAVNLVFGVCVVVEFQALLPRAFRVAFFTLRQTAKLI